MQAQTIVVFLAHALFIAGVFAQESVDASCQRYASRIGIYAQCDAREFFEPAAPASDLGLESALAERVGSSQPMLNAPTAAVPRTEDSLASDDGVG